MVRRGLVRSRSEAQRLIREGRVIMAGNRSVKPSSPVDQSSHIDLVGSDPYVGRGGDKLAAALDHFGLNAEGSRVLDVGSSVGGFTDCLLRRGAREVVAVDVGRDQLSAELKSHPRVRSLEETDIRHIDLGMLGGAFDLVVVDLSFISVCEAAPVLAAATKPGCDLVVLVKPQFEVGRDRIGRGIVSDPGLRNEAVAKVRKCLARADLDTVDVMASPVAGERGNQEYFVRASRRKPGDSAIGQQ